MKTYINDGFLRAAKEFIAIPSVEGNLAAINKSVLFIKEYLPDNFEVQILESNGMKSMVATVGGTKTPKVFLHGHTDVVPGKRDLFTLQIEKEKLIGRGVYDMKLSLLLYAFLLHDVPKEKLKDIGIMVVGDEEIGGPDGTPYLIQQGYKPEFFLTGEPSEFDIYTQAKGTLWIEITQKGKSAHSGGLWNGENAILLLQQKIAMFLERHPLPTKRGWMTTYNISKIHGGEYMNAVPDTCSVYMDIRYVAKDKPDEILAELQQIFQSCKITILQKDEPIYNDESNSYIQSLATSYEKVIGKKAKFEKNLGTTDARYYSAIGIPAISFCPMGGDAHSDNEWISKDSMDLYAQILLDFLQKI